MSDGSNKEPRYRFARGDTRASKPSRFLHKVPRLPMATGIVICYQHLIRDEQHWFWLVFLPVRVDRDVKVLDNTSMRHRGSTACLNTSFQMWFVTMVCSWAAIIAGTALCQPGVFLLASIRTCHEVVSHRGTCGGCN
eukprot:15366126-Ditylum_brightwellii.AAC.1